MTPNYLRELLRQVTQAEEETRSELAAADAALKVAEGRKKLWAARVNSVAAVRVNVEEMIDQAEHPERWKTGRPVPV